MASSVHTPGINSNPNENDLPRRGCDVGKVDIGFFALMGTQDSREINLSYKRGRSAVTCKMLLNIHIPRLRDSFVSPYSRLIPISFTTPKMSGPRKHFMSAGDVNAQRGIYTVIQPPCRDVESYKRTEWLQQSDLPTITEFNHELST